ncbi:ComF family protein [soil metagenome]
MLSIARNCSRHLLARLPSIMPTSCVLCGYSGNATICAECHAQFFHHRQSRCAHCALPLPHEGVRSCGDCLKQPPAFDATIVAADYAPPIDQLVLGLKFGGRLAVAPWLAGLLRDALLHLPAQAIPLPDRLTAVPLGAQRLAERGFNQALEIAKPLSKSLGIPLDAKLAVRVRDTQAQALLHPEDRRRNIRHSFIVPAQAIDRVRGQHIGIVDDVITTGETLHELAATLKRFGASRVTNFVFARTLPK